MSRIEVTKNRSGMGCGWILSVPLILIGTLVCFGGVFVVSMASEASDRGARQSDTYIEPVENIESARLEIVMEAGELRLNSITDTNDLFRANLNWVGEMDYGPIDAEGNVYRIEPDIRHRNPMEQFFSFMNVGANWEEEPLIWDIALNDDVPFSLDVRGSAGLVDLDLRSVTLTELSARASAGALRLMLPEPVQSYNVTVVNNVGQTEITLPPNTAVEVTADVDMGDITITPDLVRVDYDESDEMGESGVWRSADFDEADAVIRITVDNNIGELTIE